MILITGGDGGNQASMLTAEIYNPATNSSCRLPQLPERKYHHTQDGDLMCGGGFATDGSMSNCRKWNPDSGTWTQSHTMNAFTGKRFGHVSWLTKSGIYLIGGGYFKKTSELIKQDGTVEQGFALKYDTMYYNFLMTKFEFAFTLLTNMWDSTIL